MTKKPKRRLCRNCSAPIAKNAKICPACGAKNRKPFFRRVWFILLVIVVVIGGISSVSRNIKRKFEWKEMELCDRLPEPQSNVGTIMSNRDDRLSIQVEKTSNRDYKEYVEKCRSMGYSVEEEKNETDYSAFDENGYGLVLSYFEETMYIELEAPIEMGTLNWPKSEIAGLLPLPESAVGKVSSDSADGCFVYVGETSLEDFHIYIDACAACGFVVDYDRGDKFYNADDENGNHLSLRYLGNMVMIVQIMKPEAIIAEDAAEEKTDPEPTSGPAAEGEPRPEPSSGPAAEEESNPEPAQAEQPGDRAELTDGMRPEFKKAMDSYEAFMNEYCNLVNKYAESDGTDVGFLTDYADYMSKYAEVAEDFEAWDNGEMNTAETAYYIEVQARISKKLLEVAE